MTPSAAAAETKKHMDPVRWGVLGTASIATSRFIPAMEDASAARLVAVASR